MVVAVEKTKITITGHETEDGLFAEFEIMIGKKRIPISQSGTLVVTNPRQKPTFESQLVRMEPNQRNTYPFTIMLYAKNHTLSPIKDCEFSCRHHPLSQI